MKKRDFRPGWSCRCTLSTQCLHNAHSPHICCTFLTRLRPCRDVEDNDYDFNVSIVKYAIQMLGVDTGIPRAIFGSEKLCH